MVDVTLALLDQGFPGPILAISRRGLLPQAHRPTRPYGELRLDAEDRRSLVALCRAVRREVALAAVHGFGWRDCLDELRPHLQLLWQELSPGDRQRFLRQLRPWWDVHRHRLAPVVAARIEELRATGKLRVLTGRVRSLEQTADGLEVLYSPRGEDGARRLAVQRVINCTGPAGDVTRIVDPLLEQLLRDGLARPDAYGLGLDTTPGGALVDAGGTPSSRLLAVGALTRGAFWETSSVPDIGRQAELVAMAALDLARRAALDVTPGRGAGRRSLARP